MAGSKVPIKKGLSNEAQTYPKKTNFFSNL